MSKVPFKKIDIKGLDKEREEVIIQRKRHKHFSRFCLKRDGDLRKKVNTMPTTKLVPLAKESENEIKNELFF